MNLRLVITLLKWPVLQKKWIQHVWFIMKVILRQRSRMSILQCTWLEHPTRELLMNTIIENSKTAYFM